MTSGGSVAVRTLAKLVALAALMLSVAMPTAGAQDYPGGDPREICGGDALSGTLIPGGTGNVTGVCAGFVVGESVDLVINSTPIVVPAVPVRADLSANWTGFRVPADFELNAYHTGISRNQDGRVVLNGRFYVDGQGRITKPSAAPPAAKPLPRTGSNSTELMVKLGVGLVVAGGLARIVARRRRSAAVTR